jgi:hypothetical protein
VYGKRDPYDPSALLVLNPTDNPFYEVIDGVGMILFDRSAE